MPAQLGAIIGRFVERHNNERVHQSRAKRSLDGSELCLQYVDRLTNV